MHGLTFERGGRRVRVLAMAWGLLVAGGEFGCAEDARDDSHDDAHAGRDASTESDAAAGDGCTAGFERCDIRKKACQRTIAETVACLRGSHVTLPPVRLLSQDDYADEMAASAANKGTNAVAVARWRAGLSVFGLAGAQSNADDRFADQAALTAASYWYETSEIVVIDRGMPIDDEEAVTSLGHELVHAIQVEEHDLEAWTKRWSIDDDTLLAAAAVFEGEAVHYQTLLRIALRKQDADEFDWDQLYTRWQAETYAQADADDSPIDTARLRFPYAFGGQFVTRAWLKEGQAGIEALYRLPPRSTREILFGAKPEADDALRTLHAAALPFFTNDFQPVAYSGMGAWYLRAFLLRQGFDAEAALAGAQAVAGDVLSVQVDPLTGESITAWRLRLFDDAEDAWPEIALDDVESWREPSEAFFVAAPAAVRDKAHDFTWLPVPMTGGTPAAMPDAFNASPLARLVHCDLVRGMLP